MKDKKRSLRVAEEKLDLLRLVKNLEDATNSIPVYDWAIQYMAIAFSGDVSDEIQQGADGFLVSMKKRLNCELAEMWQTVMFVSMNLTTTTIGPIDFETELETELAKKIKREEIEFFKYLDDTDYIKISNMPKAKNKRTQMKFT